VSYNWRVRVYNKNWWKALYVAFVHSVLILGNTLAIPFILYFEPWYIALPLMTFLNSPLLGSRFCILNRLEDIYRRRAGMKPCHYDEYLHDEAYKALAEKYKEEN
jgi:hypothetical protein